MTKTRCVWMTGYHDASILYMFANGDHRLPFGHRQGADEYIKMPPTRIPARYTNTFKYNMVLEYEALATQGVTKSDFCREKNIPRQSLQTWERKRDRLSRAVNAPKRSNERRASHLTLGGSGRISASACIEDALCTYVKDLRRDGFIVTRDMIVAAAGDLMPHLVENKSHNALMCWCSRFMKRHRFTIRRVTHSGRDTRADMESAKSVFVSSVLQYMLQHFLDPRTSLPILRVLFNMDQTSMYCDMRSRATVELVGAPTVPSITGGGESYRCTVALTVSADGRMHPPHFVFKGVPGGTVEAQVRRFALPETATFSVQTKAWYNERVMMEWIDLCWRYIVTEPTVLILDSLKVHRSETVISALADLGTVVRFVPGGCTGIAQPLDVGVMSPFKQAVRRLNPAVLNLDETAPQRPRESAEKLCSELVEARCIKAPVPKAEQSVVTQARRLNVKVSPHEKPNQLMGFDGVGDDPDKHADEDILSGSHNEGKSEEEDGPGEGDDRDDFEGGDGDQFLSKALPRLPHSQDNVRVVPPETWHADWSSWLKYLDEYAERTMQVLPVRETMSRDERNKRLKKTKKGQHGNADLVPEGLDPYQRRPRKHIRLTDCLFRFVVQWPMRDGVWQLMVKNGMYVHNHPITPGTYGTYPCARGVHDGRIESCVDGMLTTGAKRSKIYDYLLAHDQNVIQSDVDNMVRAHASSISTADDNEATAAEVAKFAAADPENIASIDETEQIMPDTSIQHQETPKGSNDRFPLILEGKDVMAKVKTGNGKTIAFLLPVIKNMVSAGHAVALTASTKELKRVALREDCALVHTIDEIEADNDIQTEQEYVVCEPKYMAPMVNHVLTAHMELSAYKVMVFLITTTRRISWPHKMAKAFRKSKMFSSDVSARGVDYPDVLMVLQVGALARGDGAIGVADAAPHEELEEQQRAEEIGPAVVSGLRLNTAASLVWMRYPSLTLQKVNLFGVPDVKPSADQRNSKCGDGGYGGGRGGGGYDGDYARK
ncbi:hypothetical protein BBJ28_00009198 [Nothophytophthora sp. Chile5]|nr:hypothetical protein BBJ28_00009198 [Nothophytophthora sp. Chile5]